MPTTVQGVYDRLNVIFPMGAQLRPNIVSEAGARTVFVALYTGAVTVSHRWIGPKHIVWMGNGQAAKMSGSDRESYAANPIALSDRWYKENSRELRDTVITKGLLACGAMDRRSGLPITSPVPSYALVPDFADLFDPGMNEDRFSVLAEAWRSAHLTPVAIGRIALARRALSPAAARVIINFPGGGGTSLPEGPSPAIMKAVVEEFSPRFLNDPHVLWISDSRMKEAYKNAALETALGITIDISKTLPDLILVDMDPPGRPGKFLMVFVEAVASEGPVDELRQKDLTTILTSAGLDPRDCAFVTAYLDKVSGAYRGSAHELAWKSFAWFVSEPDCLLHMREPTIRRKLAELL